MRSKLLTLSLFVSLLSFGQKLPTTGLCLSNVLTATGGTCLATAFTNANSAWFDPYYAVAGGNWLDDFRNYGIGSACVRPTTGMASDAVYYEEGPIGGTLVNFSGSFASASQALWNAVNLSSRSVSAISVNLKTTRAVGDSVYSNVSSTTDCSKFPYSGYFFMTGGGYPDYIYHIVSGVITGKTMASYNPACTRPTDLASRLIIYRTQCSGQSERYFTGSFAEASQAAWDISHSSSCIPSGYSACQANSFAVNDSVYANQTGDCTKEPDGYYLLTAYQGYPPSWTGVFSWPMNVYHIVSGKIISVAESTNPVVVPTVTTNSINITSLASATSGGTISSDGGASITAKGIAYGASANPTISGSHTSDGTGTGSWSSYMTGLSRSSTYHVRAYATNSAGTGYGSDVSFATTSMPYAFAELKYLTIGTNIQRLTLTFATTNPSASNATTYMRVRNITSGSSWITSASFVSYAGESNVDHTQILIMGLDDHSGDTFEIEFSRDGGSTWGGDIIVDFAKTLNYDYTL